MWSPVVLVILDGWGIAQKGPGNAIALARTPSMDTLMTTFPHTRLEASGEAVGLPHGEDGNTETGHLNIGAGSIVYQDLPRINMAIADGSFFANQEFVAAIDHAKKNDSNLHLLGLIGAGGVHSNIEHLFALMQTSKIHNFSRVFLHLITDGRDSPPTSALTYVQQVKQHVANIGVGQIATVMGRYWAMDRDQRWDRTAKAYDALTKGQGEHVSSPEEAVQRSYEKHVTDEFIDPSIIVSGDGNPLAVVDDNDALIFFNFRIDRPRQLARAFLFKNFAEASSGWGFDPYSVKYRGTHLMNGREAPRRPFDRGDPLKNLYFVTMTKYGAGLEESGSRPAFPPMPVEHPLGEIISEKGFSQLRVAETEKERFVTFYFNGQREEAFPREDRIIIPSPSVATYDLRPEMSTAELTDVLVDRITNNKYAFIVVNVACPDMVAHTGNLDATILACEAADRLVGRVLEATLRRNGALIVTADHGNAEELINPITHGKDTEHSTFPVPFALANNKLKGQDRELPPGILADIAPTVLDLMGIPKPATMAGRSLISI